MIIRERQMAQLEKLHVKQFESSLLALLREKFPERCSDLSDEDLLVGVYATLDRARDQFGINGENAATKFVYLSWLLGQDFDSIPQHSWIQDILRHDRPSSERMEIIMNGVIHDLNNETKMLRVIGDPDAD